jgi:predicted acetyltransferase
MSDPVPSSEPFQFLDPGVLRDGELFLRLVATHPPSPVKFWVPWYQFEMFTNAEPQTVAGHINFRAVSTPFIDTYAGHYGYGVVERFRGRHYAERATRLLFSLARRHGFATIWITCNPDNIPSRRTCERLGGTFVEIVDVPEDSDMYRAGSRQKCRYRIDL